MQFDLVEDGASPWDSKHPVLEILRQRRATNSRPGSRADGDTAKVGLAVEGGGMRGVVSAAMLAALEDRGFGYAFDAVYGCSSGSINSAYFLAGGTWYPVSIYYDDLTTRRFISFTRAFRGGNVLDLDYAFGEVVEIIKPLNYDRVLASPVRLHIAITDVEGISTRLISDFTDRADLKAALLASSWLPIAVRGTATFRGWRALDGGVVTALPFRLALLDDCTHVLSLSTRPMRPSAGRLSVQHHYTHRYLERIKKGLGSAYLESVRQRHRDQLDLAVRRGGHHPPPYVLDLAPLPEDTEVKRHELRSHLLISAARRAYSLMYCAVEGRPVALLREGRLHSVPRLTVVDPCP
ncbi:patatin-like phospholipase family protein [Solwaraspora sp. WMMD1047]|uniref:patatin-like phospholipase family protein n=1 Tax=Solwaraspora sp. WMMD1047 TaxID=3016102 RepID=UPI0024166E82|nr:patatin-like phospholipase family protein [Solwaraspora sp. WMMD1047]MDG4829631.1 patatin-like phospholipase family protein [Solwaraspora sp. WMMD1047]